MTIPKFTLTVRVSLAQTPDNIDVVATALTMIGIPSYLTPPLLGERKLIYELADAGDVEVLAHRIQAFAEWMDKSADDRRVLANQALLNPVAKSLGLGWQAIEAGPEESRAS